ncbi:Hypothetical predicted protein, partial [Paramuricea clavata]
MLVADPLELFDGEVPELRAQVLLNRLRQLAEHQVPLDVVGRQAVEQRRDAGAEHGEGFASAEALPVEALVASL